jgi:hypothetical protein
MSSWKGPVIHGLLAVLLLAVAAAAQSAPLLRPVALPEGGVALLVTRIDVEGDVAVSQLLMPGGSPPAGPALGSEAEPQPFGLQRYVTRYHDAFGLLHLLATEDVADETPDQHAARHKAALDELLAQFPSADAESTPPIVPGENGTQVLKTTWEGTKFLKHEVITTRKTGESLDKWAERHADGVQALMKVFPPQPGQLVLVARPRCAQAA